VHTFPERGYLWVDIFSCKGFDDELAIGGITRAFDLRDATTRILERGLEYPHSVPDAVPLAEHERSDVLSELPERELVGATEEAT
jgi:S-adenosylmethionine decarboxylase